MGGGGGGGGGGQKSAGTYLLQFFVCADLTFLNI